MALEVGSRVAHYDVTALIGEGGMGRVYQATDTKLNRQVALKILSDAFASDPDRLARFQREAQVLASLNHPNIGQIHGIEEADGTLALVLELVEGPTLADRIARGPIPVDEALPIAKQIAEALEAAHEAGVIHRDLKPANIKVREDGTVKVLDFGLAKAVDTTPEGDPNQSPTLTAAATQMGVIMGTAAYMSPEQARGKAVDKRADIWAFGAVLFEMLTGKRAFVGEDVSLTLAEVMKSDPDLTSLPADMTSALRAALTRCLTKDPKQRVADMQDVRLAMDGAFETVVRRSDTPVSLPLQPWQRPMPAVVALAVVAVVAWLAGSNLARGPLDSGDVIRVAVALPESASLLGGRGMSLDISRDGTNVVYRAAPGSGGQGVLYLRAIDELGGAPLAGTAGGQDPFYSADGQWVGFAVPPGGSLLKVSVFGGAAEAVATLPNGVLGGTWGVDGRIVVGQPLGGLHAVDASGGATSPLTTPDADRGEISHRWPALIPDRRAVLFASTTTQLGAGSELAVLELDTGTVTRLGLAGKRPRYVSTGHVIYGTDDGVLSAVPFDRDTLTLEGRPVRLVEGVRVGLDGAADFAVSDEGRLVYAAVTAGDRSVGWVDRSGRLLSVIAESVVGSPRLSPDESRLAVRMDGDVWIADLERGGLTRLSVEGLNYVPVWMSDGSTVTFASARAGSGFNLYSKSPDSGGAAERLLDGPESVVPGSWSPDGDTLVYAKTTTATNRDIWSLSATEHVPVIATEFNEFAPRLSPNGQWLAYVSDQAGEARVSMMTFPDGEGVGLWVGQGTCRIAGKRPIRVANAHCGCHSGWRHPGHRRLHESRAGTRETGRQAYRHLVVRLRVIRNTDWSRGVPWRDAVGHDSERAGPRTGVGGAAGRDIDHHRDTAAPVLGERPETTLARHRRRTSGLGRDGVAPDAGGGNAASPTPPIGSTSSTLDHGVWRGGSGGSRGCNPDQNGSGNHRARHRVPRATPRRWGDLELGVR